MIVRRDQVEQFFPKSVAFSDGTVLSLRDIDESEHNFYVTYAVHDGARWRSASFWLPKEPGPGGRTFPWTEAFFAEQIAHSERYDAEPMPAAP